jgi:uracil-DNA glycosylase
MSTHTVSLAPGADLDGFRRALRRLVAAGARPEDVAWTTEAAPDLFGADRPGDAPPVALPRAVATMIETVIRHRDPERYALLYRLAWRVLHGEPRLLEVASDPLVHRLERMAKSVRRDIHKMHAFARFRRTEAADGDERFVAWFEPDHFILEAASEFFVDRFRALAWSILTPIGSLHWDRAALTVGPPARRDDAPASDPCEAGWRDYYESVFNPARLNLAATRAEMPRKYWRNLPETAAIPALVRSAPSRVREMLEKEAAMPTRRNPDKAVAAMADQAPRTLEELNAIIAAAPPMVEGGTRAVFGEGRVGSAIVFVGEQPGDQEDLAGRPFVGPAGRLLDRAMVEAGIDRDEAYVTNAVKHFKHVQRGKRRLHQRPNAGEVRHYQWWLKKEIDLVGPRVVVALGATAVLALAGRALPITRNRGETSFDNRRGYITVHPSYLLRLPDPEAKREAYAAFRHDLERIRDLAHA